MTDEQLAPNAQLFSALPSDDYVAAVSFAGPYELAGYADGYFKAAERLYFQLLADPDELDYLIYPLVFLYRHHVELRLKEIIRNGYYLQGHSKDFPPHHRLRELWPTARSCLEALEELVTTQQLNYLESVVTQFAAIDGDSFTFRFSEAKSGRRSLANHYHINIRQFHDVLAPALNVLSVVAFSLDDRIFELSDLNSPSRSDQEA